MNNRPALSVPNVLAVVSPLPKWLFAKGFNTAVFLAKQVPNSEKIQLNQQAFKDPEIRVALPYHVQNRVQIVCSL